MYIIEGNIGAGKTTFLQIISQAFPFIKTVKEPLADWNNKKHGSSLLDSFYQDAPRWAFTMEMFTIMCRIKDHVREQKNDKEYVVMERSLFSGYYCFAFNSYKQGFMNKTEWEIYKRWFNYMVKGKCLSPDGFIYLKTSPEVAYSRTLKRKREGEEVIPLSYFKQIDDRLDQFLIQKDVLLDEFKDIPVLVIDCEQEFETNKKRRLKMLQDVENFIIKTSSFTPAQHTNAVKSMRDKSGLL